MALEALVFGEARKSRRVLAALERRIGLEEVIVPVTVLMILGQGTQLNTSSNPTTTSLMAADESQDPNQTLAAEATTSTTSPN
ncbi:hypothetical protein Sjap_013346 [Stephania japonica]|uniref:Uncharacterized protein n=1 Tax=Stephania japonica TaxID=461633 RepID=A0AAP0NZ21_9MAGN